MISIQPFTVFEAETAVYHAWGDGMPVGGPLSRHLRPPICEEFRVGLKMSPLDAGADATVGGFGEWRRHAPRRVGGEGWLVEMTGAAGAAMDEAAVQVASMLVPGMPVVLVVRFRCEDTGLWRLFQFHDCVVLPAETGDDGRWMMRPLKFSAGHVEEFKSGVMPGLVPRLRGVIEWRHLGRVVRCWEYDADADAWVEDAENAAPVDGGTARYVSLDFQGADVDLSYMAARTEAAVSGGIVGTGIGWIDAVTLTVSESSGLILAPGWVLEAQGCAEPLLLPPGGRHWEHPRVVFRFLGRVYATIEAGVLAMPALVEGYPDVPIDFPIRLGRLVLYPEGGFLMG